MGRSGGLPVVNSIVFLAADFADGGIGGGVDRVSFDGCLGFCSVHCRTAAVSQTMSFYDGVEDADHLLWRANSGNLQLITQDPNVMIPVPSRTLLVVADDANPTSISIAYQAGGV